MPHVYQFGSFRLDSSSQTLLRDNHAVHLTAKSYAIILLLVERAGVLVSKEEILARVWPEGFIEPANLTQTIYLVRKALDDHGMDGIIQTVPGRGYRFTAKVREVELPSPETRQRRALLPALASALLIIVGALVLVADIDPRSPSQPAQQKSVRPEAQRDYVLGRHYWTQRTIPGLKLGLRYFQEALRIEPSYAQALSGIADSYSMLGYHTANGPEMRRYFQLSRATALRGIAADPNAAEPHASLAFADEYLFPRTKYEKEITAEYQRSLELDGSYATGHEWYSWWLFDNGHLKKAVAQMTIARNLDPLSPVISFAFGDQLYYNRRYKDASEQWQLAISLEPSSEMPYYGAGLADEQIGRMQRAERELKRAVALAPSDPNAVGALAHLYAITAQSLSARRLLSRIASMKPRPAYDMAVVDEGLGQHDEAIRWLTVAKSQNDEMVSELGHDPRMDSLRRVLAKRNLQKLLLSS